MTTRWSALLAGATLPLAGCLARVQETRAYGVDHAAPGGEVTTVEQRAISAEGSLCRTVVSSESVHEVDLRRSFVTPSRQQFNFALAFLAGIGAVYVAYDASALACGSDGGCKAQLSSVTWPIAAVSASLAAIPLAFVAYNAARVQDETHVEAAPPIVEPGPWRPCDATVTATPSR